MRADLALIGFILTLAGGITLLVLRRRRGGVPLLLGGIVLLLAAAAFALYLAAMGLPTAVASVLIAAFTSAFMIGGKAAGKSIAIEQSANIVLFVCKSMALFERKTTKRKKNKKN